MNISDVADTGVAATAGVSPIALSALFGFELFDFAPRPPADFGLTGASTASAVVAEALTSEAPVGASCFSVFGFAAAFGFAVAFGFAAADLVETVFADDFSELVSDDAVFSVEVFLVDGVFLVADFEVSSTFVESAEFDSEFFFTISGALQAAFEARPHSLASKA